MASLKLYVQTQIQLGYNPIPDGTIVEAWPASDFPSAPTPMSYNEALTPTASGTTSGGDVTLTGLTSDTAYYVSVIDCGNRPTYHLMAASYVGDGNTHTVTVDDPDCPETTPYFNGLVGLLHPGLHTTEHAIGDDNTLSLQITPRFTGARHVYTGTQLNPFIQFEPGDALLPVALGITGFTWPDFTSAASEFAAVWTVWISNQSGTEFLYLVNDAGDVTAESGQLLVPVGLDTDATNLYQTGSDIVVPSSSGDSITTTAGGWYQVGLGVLLQGGPLCP